MVGKNVYLGASVTAFVGIVAGIVSGSSALAPWGIPGGIVAGWTAETMSDGLYDGGLAGLLGGIAAVISLSLLGVLNIALATGNVNAASAVGAYISVVVGILIIPLFAVEGLCIGPITTYIRTRAISNR
ncbi:hypothetical protein [Haladaptatus sp. DFWS20]|uniref:hypothetical protein n=1 Tax=Haladaptatus sp. DFWS20 TaxID=3403467 RepID=UPI003EBE4A30